jgi:nucleoside-diphosphate-sugar epimerase
MKILVTGVTGFVGARLAPRLLADGHQVVGFARRPTEIDREIPVVVGDAISGVGLEEAMDGGRRRLLPDPLDGAVRQRCLRCALERAGG